MQNSIYMENLPLNHQMEIQRTLTMHESNFNTLVNQHDNLIKFNKTQKTFDTNFGKQNFVPGLQYTEFKPQNDISDHIKINLPFNPPQLQQQQFNPEKLTQQIIAQTQSKQQMNQSDIINNYVMNPNLDQKVEQVITNFEVKQNQINVQEQQLIQQIMKQQHPGSLPQFQSRKDILTIERQYPNSDSQRQDTVHYNDLIVNKQHSNNFNEINVKRNMRPQKSTDIHLSQPQQKNDEYEHLLLIEQQKTQIDQHILQINQLSEKFLMVTQDNKTLQKQLKQILKQYQIIESTVKQSTQEKINLNLQIESKEQAIKQLQFENQELTKKINNTPLPIYKVNVDKALEHLSFDDDKENLGRVLDSLQQDKRKLLDSIRQRVKIGD
ncbi:hypothetical protein SS50377_20773 [Spironucleus salmonicida]|uniref:Uncharacterized protein n=1 Tax=Spironucleus salmonicida TaxID=348837 RepID=V6LS85_9EUKA|nr:hypothetical protein SS50377_20773 [Spironucleus salmonicida]|eukprot:EST47118.1 Hypothetical protein SS50377_12827 [Spironucleus salmonicida]